ncbi:MAG: site-specific integrase [Anaerolineales bacterium]
MGRNRVKGEGSIYQRPNGRWRAQIYIHGERLTFSAITRKEALAWLLMIRNEVKNGLNVEGSKISYSDFLDDWLETKKPQVAEQTWSYYSQLVRDYMKPKLGMYKLRELSTRRIQGFYNHLVEQGVGLRTIEKNHSVIHASLNYAVKYGLIASNQDAFTDPPKPKKKEIKYLNIEEVKKLFQVAKENNDRNYAMYYLAIVTGMRQGELLGLQWKNVDMGRGIIKVNQNLKRLPSGKLVFGKPKTKTSIRSRAIGEETIEVLKDQVKRIKRERIDENVKALWKEMDMVFPSTIGRPIDPTNLLKKFRQLLKRAGLPRLRFHDLRHTSASIMLNNGVDVFVASRRLGHAKPSITLDVYGHLLTSVQNEVGNKMDILIYKE